MLKTTASTDRKAVKINEQVSRPSVQVSDAIVNFDYISTFLRTINRQIASFNAYSSDKQLLDRLNKNTKIFVGQIGVPKEPGFYLRDEHGNFTQKTETLPSGSKPEDILYIRKSVLKARKRSKGTPLIISMGVGRSYVELYSKSIAGRIAYVEGVKPDAIKDRMIDVLSDRLRAALRTANKKDDLLENMKWRPYKSTSERKLHGHWLRQEGIKEMRAKIAEFRKVHRRDPKISEQNRMFKPFFSTQWRSGNPVHIVREYILGLPPKSSWSTPDGVEKARHILAKFRENNGRDPYSKELGKILGSFVATQYRLGNKAPAIREMLGLGKIRKPNASSSNNAVKGDSKINYYTDIEQRNSEIRRLHLKGESKKKIGKIFGITHKRVSQIVKSESSVQEDVKELKR